MFTSDSNRSCPQNFETITGPEIIRSEVVFALNKAKSEKAIGPDKINVELLKLLEPEQGDVLINFFNSIYNSGKIPQDWVKSTFITLPKKRNAKTCLD
ncbi:unnamed protein product [Parnassius apollo]|uniref:(apollo) hypothetical protein n=1 Tax=Parnassius apollo TaxID=110799 RepID=A0A8S3Y7Y4_PARAO|nr:unnamed protein product [Parnassius apollo]